MRTVAEYLEKADAFQQLAAIATTDLLRTSYLDLARGYRELAEQRRRLLNRSEDEGSLERYMGGVPVGKSGDGKGGDSSPQSN
jgi:hypothetical protein